MGDVSFVASHTCAYLDVIVNTAMRKMQPLFKLFQKEKKSFP